MRFVNHSKFYIHGLNQEKMLNLLSKITKISEIDRKSKVQTSFLCPYFEYKKVEKVLLEHGMKIEKIEHFGLAYNLKRCLTSYGLVGALLCFAVFYAIESQFVLQYDIRGLSTLQKTEIVGFINQNFSSYKPSIDTHKMENELIENFNSISFVSCMIRGQTLVINVKEKLMPEQMYGNFSPIYANKDGRITAVNLISGTLRVKVGDFVRKGDVLVEPYTVDTSGNIKKVEAKAEIVADVYNQGSASHFEHFVEVVRTGRYVVQNQVLLFGLKIYSYNEKIPYKMYEVEKEEVRLNKNILLPFKMQKIKVFELVENVIDSKFDDVKEEYIEKAREKALENVSNCDKIKEEFYNLKQQAGVTVVDYCITTEENIGVVDDC